MIFFCVMTYRIATATFARAYSLLASSGTQQGWSSLVAFKAIAIVVIVVVGGRWLSRPLRFAASAASHEVFVAAALFVVVGTALIVQLAGLSMALGAFLAGVLLADSEYRHELEADIEPFKGLLLGLFFIAVGRSKKI